jgi:hypothetical protein
VTTTPSMRKVAERGSASLVIEHLARSEGRALTELDALGGKAT